MSEKVFPATKPAPPTKPTPPTTTTATATTKNTNPATTAAPNTKPHLYIPPSRAPYRQSPYNRRTRSKNSICCCCLFWSILLLLLLLLVAAIAAAVLYILYNPHRPSFSIPSLKIHRLNLTTSDSTSHLSTLFNLTLSSKNPNSHLSFSYDPISFTTLTSSNDVFLGNGSIPSFYSPKKNQTLFPNVVVSGSVDLDADAVNKLRSTFRKRNDGREGVVLKVVLDTKVVVKAGNVKSKKLGIRVTCDGIKGVIPSTSKGKSTPTLAVTSGVKCEVDLRIKIWKFTF